MKQSTILDWFDAHQRDLPWRKTDAWGIMVSEFMLQQTPVLRVLPKWHEWMEKWPDPAALAAAKKSDVISAWGRLGYPRRALRLYESARMIATEHNNIVPRAPEVLRTLPGVGDYTAAAIAAFAYGDSTLVLDINIRRFFARVYDGVETPSPSLSQYERSLREKLIHLSLAFMRSVPCETFLRLESSGLSKIRSEKQNSRLAWNRSQMSRNSCASPSRK
jgi:A/G-specific adenine glycosylase